MITENYSVDTWEITGIPVEKNECHVLVALIIDHVDDSELNSIHDQAYEDSYDEAWNHAIEIFHDRGIKAEDFPVEEYLPDTPIEYHVTEHDLVITMPDGMRCILARSTPIYDVDFYYYKADANVR